MFNNVIVGVDGRLGGRDAIALAAQLTSPDGALTLASVYPGISMPSHAITPGLVSEEHDGTAKMLEKERSEARVTAGLMTVDAPSPGRGLHELAEDQSADLLVLGSSHRGALGRALLGDDTARTLEGAPCAVAVAPRGYSTRATPIASIGVGYDGSDESEAAVAVARDLAGRTNARVLAFQVASIPSYTFTGAIGPILQGVDEMVEAAEARVKELPGVEGRAEYGLPGEELAAFSGEVDLLIVGSRNYGPLRRLVSGSTARHLLHHARGALLILPRGTAPARSASRGEAVGAETHASA